jgi:hypothetical protein
VTHEEGEKSIKDDELHNQIPDRLHCLPEIDVERNEQSDGDHRSGGRERRLHLILHPII